MRASGLRRRKPRACSYARAAAAPPSACVMIAQRASDDALGKAWRGCCAAAKRAACS